MSNLSSTTLDEVIGSVLEEVIRERAKQENEENVLVVVPGEMEIKVEAGEARAFYSNNGKKAFKKHLAKKGFVEERGFRELVSQFKEEVEKRGWEIVS